MRKKLLIAISLLLLLLFSIPLKLMLIGDPVDGAQLSCRVEQEGKALHLHVSTPASAIALKGWKYRQEGNSLYITCRKVLVSSMYASGTYETTIPDCSCIDNLYLGGRLIWKS